MKNIYVLCFLILSIQISAKEKLELSSIKTLYILEGTINNQYPITMYLNIEDKTQKIDGKYYYNAIGTPIYLRNSTLDKKSLIILKEFTNTYDAYNSTNSTGVFSGIIDKNMVFKGIWSNGNKELEFEVKPNKDYIIQKIESKQYNFTDRFSTNSESPVFEVSNEIFQIVNPNKLDGINNINKQLNQTVDFNEDYSAWKKTVDNFNFISPWIYNHSYDLIYRDNKIVSLVSIGYCYTGGAHGMSAYQPIVYSIDSGGILNKNISDLVYSVNDEKLIALLRKKLKEYMQNKLKDQDYDEDNRDITQHYFDFENIRLNNNYQAGVSGITFVYTQYEIAAYSYGIIEILFSYDELKPFVRKDSALYYLFQAGD